LSFCYSGFYFVRDNLDTGKVDNPLNLPAFPYEVALALQDRMFKEDGQLFFPAFKGDPSYDDFITAQRATVDPSAPSAIAEFFGDHIVVNGKIWPKVNVEPRKYRLRLLNGCDSRYMTIEFTVGVDDSQLIPFHILGGDQGFATEALERTMVVMEPGSRLDIIVDFSVFDFQQRIIMKNDGSDSVRYNDVRSFLVFMLAISHYHFSVFIRRLVAMLKTLSKSSIIRIKSWPLM